MNKFIAVIAVAGLLYLFKQSRAHANAQLQPVDYGVYDNPIYKDDAALNGQLIDDIGDYMPDIKPTRGERNNNPGNIRKSSSKWQGLAYDQSSDNSFAVFVSPEYGIRAMGVLLRNYYRGGLNTVRKIISKYAPSSENNTNAYIGNVAARIGATPDQIIDLNDDNTLHALVSAMIVQENGRNIYADNGVLDTAITLVG